MSTHRGCARHGLFAGLLALAGLVVGCDGNPAEPEDTTPGSSSEQPVAKGGPRATAAGWTVLDLGLLTGAGASSASDVNDDGFVVGTSGERVEQERAFLFDGVSVMPLTDVGVRSGARSVSGGHPLYVVGSIDDPAVGDRPVRWTIDASSSPPLLAHQFLSADCGVAVGVNYSGDVVGKEGVLSFGTPVIWHAGGSRTVIDAPAGHAFDGGTARDINNAGLVAVSFYGQDYDRGFVRLANGRLVELPPQPGDESSYAGGIGEVRADGSVYVAGTTRQSELVFHAVRWTVDASSGEILSTWRIDDNGSSGSTSDSGELAGGLENRWRNRPVIWTVAASTQLPLPRGTQGGFAQAISPNGRHAAGAADRTQGSKALLWTRIR